MENITAKEFMALQKAQSKRHKFGAVRCRRGEIKFPSKLERAYYDFLVEQKQKRKIYFFLRQVAFHLPGGVKYVCDFMVVYFGIDSLKIDFIDVKGKETAVYKMKKKMVEELYPITIKEVKKGEFP